VTRPAEPVAIDRTSHRSTQAALVVSGARPLWVHPDLHPEFGLPVGVPPSEFRRLGVDVTAFFVTSPSYVGTLCDVSALADAAHAAGAPLVVDQAWGAHLGFMPDRGAMAQGADVSVTSVHKALMGYSQTAVVTMRGGRLDPRHLDRCVDLLATTSPSGTLLASIDATRAVLDREGAVAIERTVELVKIMRRRLARVPGLAVLDDDNMDGAIDPFKVTLWLPRTGVSGIDLNQLLWDRGHGPESADVDTLVLTVSLVDDAAFLDNVTTVLIALIEELRAEPRPGIAAAVWAIEPEVVVTPREAFFARRRRIALTDAIGEVSAEQFCPYPPGIPLLAPGERVTSDAVDAIRVAGTVGRVAYMSDPTLNTIEVIDAL
jgi:arginine decarboxylase